MTSAGMLCIVEYSNDRVCTTTSLRMMYWTENDVLDWEWCTGLRMMYWTENDVLDWEWCTGLRMMYWTENDVLDWEWYTGFDEGMAKIKLCKRSILHKCLLPLWRTVLNVQMYRENYTAFGNNLMINRFVKLESCNKFVLKSFCSKMLCKRSIQLLRHVSQAQHVSSAFRPIAQYNSLQDRHLNHYFTNSRVRRHLCRAGLVSYCLLR